MRRLNLWLGTLACALTLAFGMPPAAQAASSKPSASAKKSSKAKTVKRKSSKSSRKVVRRAPPVPSVGQLAGLRDTSDPLNLQSSVALVVDQDTDEVLFSKNPDAVLPIASITKLMTAMVVVQGGQSLNDELTITQDDVDTLKGSSSRLAVGTRLTRGEMLHLALMSSENRAAHALGRHYPGGLDAFISAMNAKASLLGMHATHYVDPTGLSSSNRSSAQDLALLVRAASEVPLISELSTTREAAVDVGRRQLQYRNSNALVRDPEWTIALQKTGYIREAGRCVVMQAEMAGRKLIMVLLDAAGSYTRTADAERLRSWLASGPLSMSAGVTPPSAR
ncbi:MAG: D-alanyl-D-alanine endopeptidase [Burkholderiaceae bacterium]|nr:D-alanyl-D-alanine endopeptidase [Burkholderiaceae bacterium]